MLRREGCEVMAEYNRRRKETAGDWLARLTAVDASTLTPAQLDELTLRRLQAERATRRARGPSAACGPAANGLARCMEHARKLSAKDRRRLLDWLQNDFSD